MSVWSVTSHPRWQEQPNDAYGECCGQKPLVSYTKRQELVLIQCVNPACENHHDRVLAGPTDALTKWDQFRCRALTSPTAAQPETDQNGWFGHSVSCKCKSCCIRNGLPTAQPEQEERNG